MKTDWVRVLLIALICEKIVQHVVVTLALYFNWTNIVSTVAVSPSILMILGAGVAVLFVIGLVGMLMHQTWAIPLATFLALFDIVGEFVAQGRIGITITVSFIVATVLLCLTLYHGRRNIKQTT